VGRSGGRLLLLLTAAAFTAACAAGVPPEQTQLEVRAIQTRTFDTPDTKLVLKAMFNVLQDDGYVVKNAVVELGLITAAKETDLAPNRSEPAGSDVVVGPVWAFPSFRGQAPFRKTEVRDFTGNVSEFGRQTKVRVSFQRKVLDNRGGVLQVDVIDDPKFYQDFFSRMDKSVYLQQERL
jgi:hypothetical protein